MRFVRKAMAFAVLFILQSTLASAQKDISGSMDHPLVSRFPDSTISKYTVVNFDEFKVPMSRQDSGTPKSQTVEGKITRITYDTPAPRSVLEV